MADGKFFRDKHNESLNTAPSKVVNSVFSEETMNYVSAFISASGSGITQKWGAPGLYANVAGYSAGIIPPGTRVPTGNSENWYIAQAGTPSAHLMAYPPETVSARFASSDWIATE